MGITLSGQTGLLLASILLGFVLGVVYEIFRLIRVSAHCGRIAVFLLDVAYWLLCACATYVFLLLQNSGRVRILVIICEARGAALYYYSVGTIVIKRAAAADRAVKRRARLAKAAILRPVGKFKNSAADKIHKRSRSTGSFIKKETNLFKIRLKVHHKMMYNLIRSLKKQKAAPK